MNSNMLKPQGIHPFLALPNVEPQNDRSNSCAINTFCCFGQGSLQKVRGARGGVHGTIAFSQAPHVLGLVDHLDCVPFHDVKGRMAIPQHLDHPAVNLHRVHHRVLLDEQVREAPDAGAQLQDPQPPLPRAGHAAAADAAGHWGVRGDGEGVHHPPDSGAVVQEVLPQRLLGPEEAGGEPRGRQLGVFDELAAGGFGGFQADGARVRLLRDVGWRDTT